MCWRSCGSWWWTPWRRPSSCRRSQTKRWEHTGRQAHTRNHTSTYNINARATCFILPLPTRIVYMHTNTYKHIVPTPQRRCLFVYLWIKLFFYVLMMTAAENMPPRPHQKNKHKNRGGGGEWTKGIIQRPTFCVCRDSTRPSSKKQKARGRSNCFFLTSTWRPTHSSTALHTLSPASPRVPSFIPAIKKKAFAEKKKKKEKRSAPYHYNTSSWLLSSMSANDCLERFLILE